MSGLVLKLGPHERILINGAVIENGDRRSRLNIVTPNASILRLRDALHPEEVTTPVRRVCYIAQLALSGDADPADAVSQMVRGIEQLKAVFICDEGREGLDRAEECLNDGNIYQCLRALRTLLPIEDALIEGAPS
ncbi:MAG: flagellar biosynthesis repressor FlbT [Qingshengfaniella sp.]